MGTVTMYPTASFTLEHCTDSNVVTTKLRTYNHVLAFPKELKAFVLQSRDALAKLHIASCRTWDTSLVTLWYLSTYVCEYYPTLHTEFLNQGKTSFYILILRIILWTPFLYVKKHAAGCLRLNCMISRDFEVLAISWKKL